MSRISVSNCRFLSIVARWSHLKNWTGHRVAEYVEGKGEWGGGIPWGILPPSRLGGLGSIIAPPAGPGPSPSRKRKNFCAFFYLKNRLWWIKFHQMLLIVVSLSYLSDVKMNSEYNTGVWFVFFGTMSGWQFHPRRSNTGLPDNVLFLSSMQNDDREFHFIDLPGSMFLQSIIVNAFWQLMHWACTCQSTVCPSSFLSVRTQNCFSFS